uniref:uncharacterized protein K02A2.6-like n=1 Tax=Styela clava TaxID=7725 RepID=UPI00193A4298|nr:uncharacterized protein K02A2.6-like [Styela clava]
MSKDIEEAISHCSVCNSLKNHQQKEPLKLHEIPDRPWSILATDIFHWYGSEHLVLVDSYSGWFEINHLPDISSYTVIKKLKEHFARFGSPDVLFSDGGPQYSSLLFKEFAREWQFKHVMSSPEFPQSNGLAENAVKQSKNLLEKCRRDRSDPYLALLNIRNVPRDKILGSSAQRLLSRRTKGDIPISKNLLNPEMRNPKEVHDQLLHKRSQQKKYFDKSSKLLPNLNTGDIVRMQTKKGYARIITYQDLTLLSLMEEDIVAIEDISLKQMNLTILEQKKISIILIYLIQILMFQVNLILLMEVLILCPV